MMLVKAGLLIVHVKNMHEYINLFSNISKAACLTFCTCFYLLMFGVNFEKRTWSNKILPQLLTDSNVLLSSLLPQCALIYYLLPLRHPPTYYPHIRAWDTCQSSIDATYPSSICMSDFASLVLLFMLSKDVLLCEDVHSCFTLKCIFLLLSNDVFVGIILASFYSINGVISILFVWF